jgi:hypothetical protein
MSAQRVDPSPLRERVARAEGAGRVRGRGLSSASLANCVRP